VHSMSIYGRSGLQRETTLTKRDWQTNTATERGVETCCRAEFRFRPRRPEVAALVMSHRRQRISQRVICRV
jgi:hypothetical protein